MAAHYKTMQVRISCTSCGCTNLECLGHGGYAYNAQGHQVIVCGYKCLECKSVFNA
jgi:hypothetical protein